MCCGWDCGRRCGPPAEPAESRPRRPACPVAPDFSRCQSQARQAASTIAPAPKNAPACASPESPNAAAPNTTASGRQIQTIQRLHRGGPIAQGSRRRWVWFGQQAAHALPSHPPDGRGDRQQRDDHAADVADDQALRRHVQVQKRRADGGQPPVGRAQGGQHQPGVADAQRRARQAAERGDDQSFRRPATAAPAAAECPRPPGCRPRVARCSQPRRNKRATSITAAAMMNMLKPRNSRLKGVVPGGGRQALPLDGLELEAQFAADSSCKPLGDRFLGQSRLRGNADRRGLSEAASPQMRARSSARQTPWAWPCTRPNTSRPDRSAAGCGRGMDRTQTAGPSRRSNPGP